MTLVNLQRLHRIAAPGLIALALAGGLSACHTTRELGEVKNPRASIERDGAASAMLGGKVFWAFGDTFTPTGGVHSSGAYAEPSSPTVVSEPLVDGTPRQLVPFSATEQRDNDTATDGSRWVIWPSAVVPTSRDRALVFSSRFHATPEGWVDSTLVVSELDAGSTVTRRLAEPLATGANYATGIYEHAGWIYLHDCGGSNVPPELGDRLGLDLGLGILGSLPNPTAGRCRLARVRPAQATAGSAYRYWTGTTWSADPLLARATVPGTNSGLSVAWSESRGEFVALSNPGFSDEVLVATAPRPEGPWTRPKVAFTTEATSYAARIHPHLSAPDGSTFGVTYFRTDQPDRRGGVVLIDLTLAGQL
jgi:hypothetical protein